jgi:hypothetical protein
MNNSNDSVLYYKFLGSLILIFQKKKRRKKRVKSLLLKRLETKNPFKNLDISISKKNTKMIFNKQKSG